MSIHNPSFETHEMNYDWNNVSPETNQLIEALGLQEFLHNVEQMMQSGVVRSSKDCGTGTC